MLELERSLVRDWRPADAPALVRHADNRRVWRNLYDGFPNPYTIEDARKWIATARAAAPRTFFAIEVDGEAAGGIGVTLGTGNFKGTASIGYWLGQAHWGRGILSEALPAVSAVAFESFDLRRIEAAVFAWNPASMRVLEKSGYVREGVRRAAAVKDGEVVDLVVYAALRDCGQSPERAPRRRPR
jgi:RimJ/RimL family protein N-acetyltransferase